MAVAAGGTEAYWLCCCTCRRSSSARVALMVSNCGHVHCSGCRRRYGDGTAQCDVCRQSAMFLAVDNKIQKHAKVGHYFRDIAKATEKSLLVLKFQQYHKMKDALKNSGMEWGCSNEQAELERDFGEVAKSSVSELQKRLLDLTGELKKTEQASRELDTDIARLEHFITQHRYMSAAPGSSLY